MEIEMSASKADLVEEASKVNKSDDTSSELATP